MPYTIERVVWLLDYNAGKSLLTPCSFEVGDALARPPLRQLGVVLIARIRRNPNNEVDSITPDLFQRALAFYESRMDKEWGLTDCISFVVMADRGITEALAADQHFVQAGFRALPRET
jgi:uncharacterized protein